MAYEIIDYGSLDDDQQKKAVELFMEGFGSMMTFSKDGALIRNLLVEIFDTELFKCYVEDGKVLGLIGVATNVVRRYDNRFSGFLLFKNHILHNPAV